VLSSETKKSIFDQVRFDLV